MDKRSPQQQHQAASSSRPTSSAALRASQADKASLARPILSLEPAQTQQQSLLDIYMARAEHVASEQAPPSANESARHDGDAAPPPPAYRRSLRRPPPLQGLRAKSSDISTGPRTPYSPDMRALHQPPGGHHLSIGETSNGLRRTTGGGVPVGSPKRTGSSSPEADARKRNRARPTAEERAASGHIPRPPNSFMLYRSAQNKLLSQVRSEEGDKLQQADLSRMIAQMWQDETPEVREHYAKQAAAEKAEHALKYPGYTYRPKSSGRRKAIKFKSDSVSPKGRSRQLAAVPPPPPPTTAPDAMPSVLTSPAPEFYRALPLSPFWPLSPAGSTSYFGSATSDEEEPTAPSAGVAHLGWSTLRSVPPDSIDPNLTQAPSQYGTHLSSSAAAGIPASAPVYSDLAWQGQPFGLPFTTHGVVPSQSYPPSAPLPDTLWSSSVPNTSSLYLPPIDYSNTYTNGNVDVDGSRGRPTYDNALQVSGLLGFDGACTTLDPSYISR
ncbi:hypothetical protein JCM3774_005881 [Rhodotorula dairenensis]